MVKTNNILQKTIRLVLIVGAIILTGHFAYYLISAWHSLLQQDEINYGEGIVWQQALLMMGNRSYGDINQYPWIVFHYPPVFHFLSLVVNSLSIPFPAAGRLVSELSALGIAFCIASLSSTCFENASDLNKKIAFISAGLVTFSAWPLLYWSLTMRVDTLAIFLGLLGLLLAIKSRVKPYLGWFSIVCFVLAVYTKQTEIAAPIAGMVYIAMLDWKKAVKIVLTGFSIGLMFLAVMMWHTHGGFLQHIVGYNINRFSLEGWAVGGIILLGHIPLIIFGIIGFVSKNSTDKAIQPTSWKFPNPRRIIILYAVLSSLIATSTLFKSGSDLNYLIEPLCALCISIGWFTAYLWNKSFSTEQTKPISLAITLCTCILLVVGLGSVPVPSISPLADPDYIALRDRVAHSSKPVLSDDMVLLLQAGKQVPWESAIFAELAAQGRWDEHKIIQAMREGKFSFLILFTGNLSRFESRYTPQVQAAIKRYYPHEHQMGRYTVVEP